MPQTTPEQAARWPGGDTEAMSFLRGRGYRLGRDWCWRKDGNPDANEREADAISYLIHEWDFGGYVRDDIPES